MSTPAHSPLPPYEPARRDPDDALGAKETQVVPVAPAEGRPSPEDIAREAYLIYIANGALHGRHEEDWYEAERRLSGRSPLRQSDATPQQAAAQLEEVDTKDRTSG